jgi:hypothetical protein
MNLELYLKKNPTKTLADIQAHTETSTRMISNKTMALLLRSTRTYLLVHEVAQGKRDIDKDGVMSNHPAKELCLLIVNSLADSTTDNNDFNFIIGHSKGDAIIADTEYLRDVSLVEYKPQISALLDACISHCNIESKPFEAVTQQALDKAKSAVPTPPENVAYVSGDYATKTKGRDLIVDVVFTDPLPFDVRVDLKVLIESNDGTKYIESSAPVAVPVFIKQSENGRFGFVSREFSGNKKLKFSAVCSHNLEYSLAVRET